MPLIHGDPGRGRYLISGRDSDRLQRFVDEVRSDPELTLLDLLGPPGAPHTAVFDMAHESAARLQQSFAAHGELNIEPDRPLSLFDGQPPGQ